MNQNGGSPTSLRKLFVVFIYKVGEYKNRIWDNLIVDGRALAILQRQSVKRPIVYVGGSGELGSSLSRALFKSSKRVLNVSRRTKDKRKDSLNLSEAESLISQGLAEAVLVNTSVGNFRQANYSPPHVLRELILEAIQMELPIIHLSSVRVLEGYEGYAKETSSPSVSSPYGNRNREYEEYLSGLCQSNLFILRISNYLTEPQSKISPQSRALPWSLMLDGHNSGELQILKSESSALEFVSPDDLALAILLILNKKPQSQKVFACGPGKVFTFGEIAEMVQQAIEQTIGRKVSSTFGSDQLNSVRFSSTWLSENGWSSSLSKNYFLESLIAWGRRFLD